MRSFCLGSKEVFAKYSYLFILERFFVVLDKRCKNENTAELMTYNLKEHLMFLGTM